MQLVKLAFSKYKGYAGLTEFSLAPLTILVGPNNSGKTALAKSVQLLAGGLAPVEAKIIEPLPLESGGILHGNSFEDLVTGRSAHGHLELSATFRDNAKNISLSATIANVLAPSRPAQRQIRDWTAQCQGQKVRFSKQDYGEVSLYEIRTSDPDYIAKDRPVNWRGLIPLELDDIDSSIGETLDRMRTWASSVRHLACPRRVDLSPFVSKNHDETDLGPCGENTPKALAADDSLRESVREWYQANFGVTVDIAAQGAYSELVASASARDTTISLSLSGLGISHVLPVVAMALTAKKAGQGVDVIEHPEAELHPAAHGCVADLLIGNIVGPERPLIIETHSEIVLLRARRWVAEGRLDPEHVLIYWVQTEPDVGSTLNKIEIDHQGNVSDWPEGVFIESYDEIMALRRAARPTHDEDDS